MNLNGAQKPFACGEKGCEMTFTNEDHLNWHQKKHDMMLNLGLTKNNDIVADQTPTPTRFIRNCEEVGLFQDLQNVNPFDEFFKKAVEVTKNGGTLEVPQTNTDDTLHTPHILPHIEENQKKITGANQDDNNSQSNDFSLNVITMTATGEKAAERNTNTTKSNSPPIIVIDDDSNDQTDIRKRIKEALQNKEKQKVKKNTNGGGSISVVPFQNLAATKEIDKNRVAVKKNNANEKCDINDEREKVKEMNRAAQIRCRRKKQKRWQEMEENLTLLKAENQKLKMENYSLRQALSRVRCQTNTDTCEEPLPGTIIGTLIPIIGHQEPAEIGSTLLLPKRVCSSASSESTIVNPMLINLAVPADNLQANTTTKSDNARTVESLTNSSSLEQKKVKKRCLRKIIPKILIEN